MTFEYVCLLITVECNLKCKYCYRNSSSIPYISTNKFVDYLTKLKRLGTRIINITGGEPLLHEEWRRFIGIAYDMDFNIALSTNSVLLDLNDEILKKIDVLVIPLDGISEQVDSKTRGSYHFNYAISIVEKYKSGKYPFRLKVNTVVTKYNFEELSNMAAVIQGKDIFWRPFFCKQKGYNNHMERENLVSFSSFLYSINNICASYPDLLMMKNIVNDALGKISYTIVVPDGSIIICKGEDDFFLANMNTNTCEQIADIIRTNEFQIDTLGTTLFD